MNIRFGELASGIVSGDDDSVKVEMPALERSMKSYHWNEQSNMDHSVETSN